MANVIIDYNKCTGDKSCISVCPQDVFDEENGKAKVARVDDCIACHACESACPEEAITVED